jgi:hypothetical protein
MPRTLTLILKPVYITIQKKPISQYTSSSPADEDGKIVVNYDINTIYEIGEI